MKILFAANFLFLFCLFTQETEAAPEEKKSNHVLRKLEQRQKDRKIDPHIEEQFGSGRLLAAIASRPGQCGRADGYGFSSLLCSNLVLILNSK